MVQIAWGLGNQGGFQNALATGMQMGAQARQAREQREQRNALAAYAVDPNEANTAAVAQYAPGLVMQQREREVAREEKLLAEQRTADLTRRAMSGDKGALGELATVNFDRWKALDGQQREEIKQQSEAYANAAMDVLQMPAEQRAQAVLAYGNRFGSQEIAALADLPPQELEQALRAAVAEGGMVQQLITMERPDYQPLGFDQEFVNTRDPNAMAEIARRRSGGGTPPAKTVGGTNYYQNPETGQWFDNPEEAMGGGVSNGTGGF